MHGTTKDRKYFLLWHLGTPASLGTVRITLATEGKHTTYDTGLCLPQSPRSKQRSQSHEWAVEVE